MWVLPKSLISAFAPAMAALSLDSEECSQICKQSLIRRSKPSQSKSFLREWKAGNLTRLRSGAILSHSLGQSFVTAWTSSLEATHASHLAQPGSALEPKTHDIFGLSSQAEFDFFDQSSASLRTSKDTLRWDSPASSAIWKNWVTKCRGEYLARLNAARRTSVSAFSSWPTATTRDWKDAGDMSQSMIRKDGKKRMDTLGRVVQANLNTHGSRPESWSTPTVTDANAMSPEMRPSRIATGRTTEYLARQIQWPTPRAACPGSRPNGNGGKVLKEEARKGMGNGKLNPRWVETLMGLPVGWTMPSCQSPATIGPTNCASSATGFCQQRQS